MPGHVVPLPYARGAPPRRQGAGRRRLAGRAVPGRRLRPLLGFAPDWGSLQPDRLAEYHASRTLTDVDALSALLAAVVPAQQAQLITLSRGPPTRTPTPVAPADRDRVLRVLDAALGGALDGARLGIEAVGSAIAALPERSRATARLQVRLTAGLVGALRQLMPTDRDLVEPDLAISLARLSSALAEVGCRAPAAGAVPPPPGPHGPRGPRSPRGPRGPNGRSEVRRRGRSGPLVDIGGATDRQRFVSRGWRTMRTEEFEFDHNAKDMPTDPVELRGRNRESGKMVVLERATGTIDHTEFPSILDHLQTGDLLVLNDSYMMSNTLAFRHGGKTMDVIVFGHEPDGANIARIDTGLNLGPGATLTSIDDPELRCTLVEPQPDHLWKVMFEPAERLVPALDRHGRRSDETVPLDPAHWQAARGAYRSVYAKKAGSLEIPSAGLHFSRELLERIAEKGVEIAYITLHVGATEILAVRHISAEEVENHKVRSEYFEVGEKAAAQINRALADGRRIVAVGTTVMRTLESLTVQDGPPAAVQAQKGWTDLYIYPGFRFRIVKGLVTNLHRPRSSHIVLTAAFGGKDLVMRSYAEILEKGGYEFDMFGDCMLIL
ncbi:S-adenosylmethionine:tRNA ribosyltransferase-isomerase [Kitasatospora sp. NPDC059673]|uniref:S-adenosylmethionine:tRNA ribosyltransferase-isomerase n=1 Tax=Kitasatospora sp. NPDC059673 TaxID=3346901 RepID=UPI0036AA2851